MKWLGYLLHLANSSPGWDRRRFYDMKTRILLLHGRADGFDIQRIPPKECWTCGGSGWFSHNDRCRRCGGSGQYAGPVWVVLQRYLLGGFTFHIPRERSYVKPDPDTTNIHGYIEHADCGVKAKEAGLWLALIFDRGLWWREMTTSAYCRWQWWPMLALNRVCMRCAMVWSDCKRRCSCGRHTWKSNHFVCKACDHVREEPPF